MSERELTRQRRWQVERLERGLCQSCGVRPRMVRDGVKQQVYCEDCRERMNRARLCKGLRENLKKAICKAAEQEEERIRRARDKVNACGNTLIARLIEKVETQRIWQLLHDCDRDRTRWINGVEYPRRVEVRVRKRGEFGDCHPPYYDPETRRVLIASAILDSASDEYVTAFEDIPF